MEKVEIRRSVWINASRERVWQAVTNAGQRNLPDKTTTTTYLLEEENGGTRFTVIEAGLESLSEEARRQRLHQNGKSWEMALENLKAYIDGKALPRPEGF